jgi:protein O-mannosyl-transferase
VNAKYPIDVSGNEASVGNSGQLPLKSAKPRAGIVQLLLLAAAAVIPYLNSLNNSFVYDDFDQVVNNPYIRNFHYLRQIFTTSVWSFMGDFRGSTNYYRPVMSLGYLLCYQISGPQARTFHLFNLLLNVGVVFLVFLVTRSLFRSAPIGLAAPAGLATPVGLAAATIFALHPIHTEVVDWVAAATELELATFFLLTFWLYLESARPEGKVSTSLQIAMVGSFTLALLSKEQALMLPVLAGIYEHFFRDDRTLTTLTQKLRRYGLLWLLPLAYLAVRIHYLGRFAPNQERTDFGAWDLVISALALIGRYCWKLIWPAQLCAYYVFPQHASVLDIAAIWGAAALVLCALLFILLWKSSRQAAFGVVWFLITLAPVLNVRLLASNAFAERYLYLASAGFCWVLGWALIRAWNFLSNHSPQWRIGLALAVALLAFAGAIRIFVRNRDWHDNLTFYTATLKVSPDSYYMHNNLGTVYWQMGNVAVAKKEWIMAIRLAQGSEYVLHNLGLAANSEKQYQRARAFYLYALKIRPDYMDAHLDLGITYEAMGRMDDAATQFTTAEKLSPLSVRVHNTLSEFYLDQRDLEKAKIEASTSLEILPTTQASWDLGLAEWLQEDRRGAERAFLDALALSPTSARAHFMLGLFYMDSGRSVEAQREYRSGLQIDPNNAEAIANLKKLEFLQTGSP